ncbi:hypothetical protein LX64_04552 [Chitinophaga skermanii]|uniref:Type IX secretion system PorP/SprF family membrane protein n=1 Tax=Chitinophaga skermanii TaxID=331697 RepID=A0A327Q4Q5_9BACT|nr:transporter [Chitinophaga skermanii]RAI99418.1 hypothetical protein LX64_04552 [Chitinophaga skermanii]
MRRFVGMMLLCSLGFTSVKAQELYVNSEPASNMPAKSLGLRLTNKFMKMQHDQRTAMRFDPEMMVGINKNWMMHGQTFFGNVMQDNIRFEGASVYAKYRFLSNDQPHAHFRMAAYARVSVIDNPYLPTGADGKPVMHAKNEDLDLEGGASGANVGIVATELLHKLALSGTLGYNRYTNNVNHNILDDLSRNAVNYSISAGYLLFPKKYKSYEQTNMNLYVEFLGKSNMDAGKTGYYVDVAPAIQFIFNSTTRLDFSYRTQLAGDMQRQMLYSQYLVRVEHNIFNAFKKRK